MTKSLSTILNEAAWPCGHVRTSENTQRIGKAGIRCRECRRRIAREWARRYRAALRTAANKAAAEGGGE